MMICENSIKYCEYFYTFLVYMNVDKREYTQNFINFVIHARLIVYVYRLDGPFLIYFHH